MLMSVTMWFYYKRQIILKSIALIAAMQLPFAMYTPLHTIIPVIMILNWRYLKLMTTIASHSSFTCLFNKASLLEKFITWCFEAGAVAITSECIARYKGDIEKYINVLVSALSCCVWMLDLRHSFNIYDEEYKVPYVQW